MPFWLSPDKMLLFICSQVNYLYGLTLFENYIYATKWQTNATIIRIDKFDGSVSELSTVTNRAGAIHVVHAAKQSMRK